MSELAKAAADWWAAKIGEAKFDAGLDSNSGSIAQMFATVMASKDAPTAEQIEVFKNEMINYIDDNSCRNITFDVDYGPDSHLSDFADKANIKLSVFPWKTVMTIKNGVVMARCGYGSPWKEIYRRK